MYDDTRQTGTAATHRKISKPHLAALAASGITSEHAAARGYETVTDAERLAQVGIVKAARDHVPGLLVPMLDVQGSTWGYQYRPDNPRLRQGGPVKYETPYQQRNGLDIPPGVGERLGDPNVPLWVTEGCKKADCGALQGLCIVALAGVWNWLCTNTAGGKVALPDWRDVALNRRVILAFDGDAARKPAVQKALHALAQYLAYKGGKIEYLHLPDTADKTGLDDYLVDHNVAELWKLVKPNLPTSADSPEADEAEPVEPTTDVRVVFPPPSDPMRVARKLYRECMTGDLRTLLHWRGGWMRWDTTHWTEADTAELRSRVYTILEHADYMRPIKEKGVVVDFERTAWEPNKRKVSDVMEAMAAIGYLSTDFDPPAWIAHSADAHEVISCTNGLLDLSTRTPDEHTPALFNVVSVPFDYQPDAAEPAAWLDFLKSVWGDDADSIALLQEYMGYVLSGRTDMQKMLLLIGPTRSGKGTIARILTALIGKGHVAGPTLASLGTNFALSPLLGKPLAIISDARLGSNPTNVVVERLLSITGEDMLTVDRKFRDPWSGKLPTRFVILSNELPKFRDSSGAIANRMLILQMVKSFLGEEDRTLDERLRAELPGILLWALDGLDRLSPPTAGSRCPRRRRTPPT
jgi:P4 family phage/plasmid primase-like protien